MTPSFTIGIEEEYQTIDPETFDLRSHINAQIIAKGKRQMDERVKAEMHQSVVEVGTGVCRNMKEARADIVSLRRQMVDLAQSSTLTSATCRSSRTCNWWHGRISSSVSTYMWASRIARRPSS
jgi:carboxylate-amine ligase